MLNWFQALLPKEGKFFDLFDAHTVTLQAGARSLRQVLDGGDGVPGFCADVARHEEGKCAAPAARDPHVSTGDGCARVGRSSA